MPLAEIDLVLVPGLAFDREGYRLGYGGGHYDRFLTDLERGTTAIGVCYAAQLLDRIPHGPSDQRVHLVVTDRETVVAQTQGERSEPGAKAPSQRSGR